MADDTYAIVDKARKSARVDQSSEVNQAIYTAVDKSKKKKNRNVLTAEPTFSQDESSMFNRDALQEPTMEEAESEYSMINAESMTQSESYFVSQAKTAQEKATEKGSEEVKYPLANTTMLSAKI